MATRPQVKVRTGCFTCKARKVKCDESKPECRRCIGARRKCDGYPDTAYATRVLPYALKRIPATTQVLVDPKIDNFISNALANDELRWLDHFSCYTGVAMSNCLDSQSFWFVELPQLSLSEPAVRHALLAVSSCHAHFETQIGSIKPPNKMSAQNFTIKHYNMAIASLQQSPNPQGTKLQVALVCCLLFICLECLYGNTALTLTHLQNGLKILESLHRFRESRTAELKMITDMVEAIFDKFKAQSTVFGIPSSFASRPADSMDFTDASGAETTLDGLVTASMSFVKHMRHEYGIPQCPDDDPRRPMQKTLLVQLRAWEAQIQALEQSDPPRVDTNNASIIKLHVRQEATFVFVAVCLDPQQTFCDAFLPQFKVIINLIERFVARRNNANSRSKPSLLSSAFSLESSMIPSLYLTAIRCRDSAIRHRAIDLLENHFGREGLWDARLYAKAARRVVEIEEASVPVEQQDPLEWPDERSRVYRTDVQRISEDPDPARSARLVFHTAPNGYLGDKVVWSENIMF